MHEKTNKNCTINKNGFSEKQQRRKVREQRKKEKKIEKQGKKEKETKKEKNKVGKGNEAENKEEKKNKLIERFFDGYERLTMLKNHFNCLRQCGIKLYVLSAGIQEIITEALKTVELTDYFEQIIGLQISGESKSEIIKQIMSYEKTNVCFKTQI